MESQEPVAASSHDDTAENQQRQPRLRFAETELLTPSYLPRASLSYLPRTFFSSTIPAKIETPTLESKSRIAAHHKHRLSTIQPQRVRSSEGVREPRLHTAIGRFTRRLCNVHGASASLHILCLSLEGPRNIVIDGGKRHKVALARHLLATAHTDRLEPNPGSPHFAAGW